MIGASCGSFLGDEAFVGAFDELVRLRRDVRRFRQAPVSEKLIAELVAATQFAPSVGLSEPTRLVRLASAEIRAGVLANFEAENKKALAGYDGPRAQKYSSLKLAGLHDAPAQFAIYCDEGTAQGHGLGARTMPETKSYSSACAVMLMWLAAAARGLGLGWVSIFDVEALSELLKAEPEWKFMGCVCIGWPEEQHFDPELERAGWEMRRLNGPVVISK